MQTEHKVRLPWYIALLGVLYICQTGSLKTLQFFTWYWFLSAPLGQLAFTVAGVALLFKIRLGRYLALLLVFLEGISVVWALLLWVLSLFWPGITFNFSLEFSNKSVPTSIYIPGAAYSAAGLFTWLQYKLLTTSRTREVFSISRKVDLI